MDRPRSSRHLPASLGATAAALTFCLTSPLPWLLSGCGSEAVTSSATSGGAANGNGSASASTTTPATSKAECTVQPRPTCADPNAGPSYSKGVADIIYGYCLQCHDPNGVANIGGSSHPFMPPPGGYGGAFGPNPNDANRPSPPSMASNANGGPPMAGNANAGPPMAGNANAGPPMAGNANAGPPMAGNANQAEWDGRAEYDWSSYPNIRRHAGDMITVLTNCVMPPSNATSLDDANRTMLLQWLACGAQDN